MLSISNLRFGYGNTPPVLNGVDFSVGPGEIVSLLGPSGCGKSTVLRLVAGLVAPDEGKITWKQQSEPPEIGFVFQDAALMPWANVQDNVALPLSLRGQRPDNGKLNDLLTQVGLGDLGDRYPKSLSGGQRMRVSIARALAAQAGFLLLDEPFAALDEILRFRMNELLLNLRYSDGWAGLFVTHSIYEAVYMSDRILVMDRGRITGEVTPGLDRSLPPVDQRASAAFADAAKQVSQLLEAGSLVDA